MHFSKTSAAAGCKTCKSRVRGNNYYTDRFNNTAVTRNAHPEKSIAVNVGSTISIPRRHGLYKNCRCICCFEETVLSCGSFPSETAEARLQKAAVVKS